MANISDVGLNFEDNFVQFSSSLYGAINKTGSLCLSPYSVATAFLLLMLGTNGRSKSQISSVVLKNSMLTDEKNFQMFKELNERLFPGKDVGVELRVANKLFVSNRFTLKHGVESRAKEFFKANIGHKNFAQSELAAKFMNRWIAKRTNQKIKDLISSDWLDALTVMVLVNAVYFKGDWETKFNASKTIKEDFHVSKTVTKKVDMMNMKHNSVSFYSEKHYSAIALPYKGDKFEMVFILPKDIEGLQTLEKNLTPEFIKTVHSRFTKRIVKISIPKMTIESEFDLKPILKDLGITDIFDEKKADFSRLIKELEGGMFVSKAVHKTVIEVNEEGTEAAAATVVVVRIRSGPPKTEIFNANHPFLFYIRDRESKLILFLGRFSP